MLTSESSSPKASGSASPSGGGDPVAEQKLSTALGELGQVTSQLTSAQRELSAAKSAARDATAQRDSLEERLKNVEADKNRGVSERELLKVQLGGLQADCDRAKARIDSLEGVVSSLKSENSSLGAAAEGSRKEVRLRERSERERTR
jgi:chromosome segregation ATPase